jgi:hypothetical protein
LHRDQHEIGAAKGETADPSGAHALRRQIYAAKARAVLMLSLTRSSSGIQKP